MKNKTSSTEELIYEIFYNFHRRSMGFHVTHGERHIHINTALLEDLTNLVTQAQIAVLEKIQKKLKDTKYKKYDGACIAIGQLKQALLKSK